MLLSFNFVKLDLAFDEFILKMSISLAWHSHYFILHLFKWLVSFTCLEVKHGSYVSRQQLTGLCRNKGSFNNYVDKKRREGVSKKSTLGHVTKARYHVKCPQLSTRGGGGRNWLKLCPRSCWNVPQYKPF